MSEQRKLRVYVAGAWVEKERRAMPWMARLRREGVVITHDWTVDEVPSTVATDAHLPFGERQRRADDDLYGVHGADVVWLLAPEERGASGAWTEFGFALGIRKWQSAAGHALPMLVVASGKSWQRTIFTSQADFGHIDDSVAFHRVLGHRAKLL